MPELLIHGDFAYTNEVDLYRHTRVGADKAARFSFEGATPDSLWRIDGPDGSVITVDFDEGLRIFNKNAYRMARIRVIFPITIRRKRFFAG